MENEQKTTENQEDVQAQENLELIAKVSEGMKTNLELAGYEVEDDKPEKKEAESQENQEEEKPDVIEIAEGKSYKFNDKEYDHETLDALIKKGEEFETKSESINQAFESATEYDALVDALESDPQTVLANLVKEYGGGKLTLVDPEGEEVEPKVIDEEAQKAIAAKEKELQDYKASQEAKEQTAKAVQEIESAYAKLNDGTTLDWTEVQNDPMHPAQLAGHIRKSAIERHKTDESVKIPSFEMALKQVYEKQGKKPEAPKGTENGSNSGPKDKTKTRKPPGEPEVTENDPELKKSIEIMEAGLKRAGITP